MKIGFMKFVDEYFGTAILALLSCVFGVDPRPRSPNPSKILVVKFWGIGSVTLSTSLLVRLRQRYPEVKIHYLTLESNRELCSLIPEINSIHSVTLSSARAFVTSFTRELLEIRRQHFDTMFDLEFYSNVSALAGFLSGAPNRIGFANPRKARPARKRMYTQTIPFRDNEHVARNFVRLLEPVGPLVLSSLIRSPEPHVLVHQFPVVMNINSSPLAYERLWSRNGFNELARHLINRFGAHIFLTGTPGEMEYVSGLEAALDDHDNVTNLAGKTTIRGLVDLISSSSLVVTNDSGPLHLASALNVPTISFFGPETPRRYNSLADHRLTFYAGLWCSPCMTVSNLKTVNCINGGQCMKQIRFPDIERSVDRFVYSIRQLSPTEQRKVL